MGEGFNSIIYIACILFLKGQRRAFNDGWSPLSP